MELLTNLGIDWRLFTAQVVNFVILLILLHRFLYKPMLKFLDERSIRIANGLRTADTMAVKVAALEAEREHVLNDARREAEKIVSAAIMHADASRVELMDKARIDAMRIIEEGKTVLAGQQRIAIDAARKEVAGLVVSATRKVLGELVSHDIDTDSITEAVRRLGRA